MSGLKIYSKKEDEIHAWSLSNSVKLSLTFPSFPFFQVRNLLCLLTRDLPDATQSLCNLILTRVKLVLSGIAPFSNIDSSLRHEMSLLESMVAHDDSCWEQKLKVVLEIFLLACR